MRYPVRIFAVAKTPPGSPPALPELKDEIEVEESGLDEVRLAVQKRVAAEGYTLRSLSFSPDPRPLGSVIVYVWKQ